MRKNMLKWIPFFSYVGIFSKLRVNYELKMRSNACGLKWAKNKEAS
jgi:hypothetical protein